MSEGVLWGLTLYWSYKKTEINHWFLITQTQKIGMSLVAASEDDTSDQNDKPSTPPHLTSPNFTIITTRKNLHLAISTWGALPASRPTILSRFEQNCIFASSFFLFLSLIMSDHASFLCFIYLPFLHHNVLPKAQQNDPRTYF